MQTKAEEKRKGYCCVVWAERAVTRADLDRVEALSREGTAVDEDGEACVEVRLVYVLAEKATSCLRILLSRMIAVA
jgi:hypothetical protein